MVMINWWQLDFVLSNVVSNLAYSSKYQNLHEESLGQKLLGTEEKNK